MDGSSNNSSCDNALNPDTLKNLRWINTAFSLLGMISCLIAVFLILGVKAHSSFVYRLMLYLAISTFCLELSIGFQTLPTAYIYHNNISVVGFEEWEGVCVAIAYAYQTLWFVQVFTVAWICIYVFALSVLQVSMANTKYHVAGLCLILLLPFLISWIPLVNHRYGFSPRSYACWIIDACTDKMPMVGHMMQLFISSLPAALVLALGLILLCWVGLVFLWRIRRRYLKPQHWMALKEVIPLLIYAMLNCVVTILSCALHVYMMLNKEKVQPAVIALMSSCIFQFSTTVLPLMVFGHPSYLTKAKSQIRNVMDKFWSARSKLFEINWKSSESEGYERDALLAH